MQGARAWCKVSNGGRTRAARSGCPAQSAASSLPPVRSVAPRHAGGAGLHAHATGAQSMRSYPGDSDDCQAACGGVGVLGASLPTWMRQRTDRAGLACVSCSSNPPVAAGGHAGMRANPRPRRHRLGAASRWRPRSGRLDATRCNPPGKPAGTVRNRCTMARSPYACAWRRRRWHPRGKPGCTWCSRCSRLPRSRPPAAVYVPRDCDRRDVPARPAPAPMRVPRHRRRAGSDRSTPGPLPSPAHTDDSRHTRIVRIGSAAAGGRGVRPDRGQGRASRPSQCSKLPRYQRCCASASIGLSSRLSPYACTQSYRCNWY